MLLSNDLEALTGKSIFVSVDLAYYEDFKKSMKIHAKMESKSEPEIDVWAIRAPTFEVLGRFLRSLIFDEFSNGEKSA